jgi:hypothetical protein
MDSIGRGEGVGNSGLRSDSRLNSLKVELDVCDRCNQIDDRIQHYEDLAKFVTDRAALESLARLISDLKAERQNLHPNPDK